MNPIYKEGECFAHVAEQELQISVLVEELACKEAKDVQSDFAVPVETMIGKEVGHVGGIIAMKFWRWGAFRDRPRRGVKVHRDVERLMCGKDGPEELVVVEATVGGVVD